MPESGLSIAPDPVEQHGDHLMSELARRVAAGGDQVHEQAAEQRIHEDDRVDVRAVALLRREAAALNPEDTR